MAAPCPAAACLPPLGCSVFLPAASARASVCAWLRARDRRTDWPRPPVLPLLRAAYILPAANPAPDTSALRTHSVLNWFQLPWEDGTIEYYYSAAEGRAGETRPGKI